MSILPRELLGDDPVDCVAGNMARAREDRARYSAESVPRAVCAKCNAPCEWGGDCGPCGLKSLDERIAAAREQREPTVPCGPKTDPRVIRTPVTPSFEFYGVPFRSPHCDHNKAQIEVENAYRFGKINSEIFHDALEQLMQGRLNKRNLSPSIGDTYMRTRAKQNGTCVVEYSLDKLNWHSAPLQVVPNALLP